MKVYVTARFKGVENKDEIEALCAAVRAAGMEDFCFVRDIEHYQHTFSDVRELWRQSLACINACDALLIDVSDEPTGGRVVEAGIAYGLGKPVYVIAQIGVAYKGLFDGVSSRVIIYETLDDVTEALAEDSI